MCNSTPGATALLQGNSGMHVLGGMPAVHENEGTKGIRKNVTVDSQAREIIRTASAQRHNESEVKGNNSKGREGILSYCVIKRVYVYPTRV